MTTILTVILNSPPRSLTEMRSDVDDAHEAVSDIASRMGAVALAHQGNPLCGYLMRDVPTSAPLKITHVLGQYEIEVI